MKAMVAEKFGEPDVLKMREIEMPEPTSRQLLVKVVASSVNPVDCKIRQKGDEFGLSAPLVLGYDASGVVELVGCEVSDFKPGDEVFYTAEIFEQGCNAEYHVVDQGIVVLKPENLSHEQTASLPLAGCTAWQGLVVRAGVRAGQRVLIHGAGGVGSLAAQIAVAAGAETYVSCSDYMIEEVQSWGVAAAIDHKQASFADVVMDATAGEGVDIVFNTVGHDLLTRSIPVTSSFGTLVCPLDPGGPLSGAYRKNLSIELLFMQRERASMLALRRMALRKKIRPLVDSVVALDDLAQAHVKLERGGVKGKIVVRI